MSLFPELDTPHGEDERSLLSIAERSVDLFLHSLICLNGVYRENLPPGLIQLIVLS